MLPFDHRQSEPSRSQDASEVAMLEERDISAQRPKTDNEAISAVGNLRGRFTPGTAVPKEIPGRPPFANVRRASSFVLAIVPLRQVRFDFGRRTQAGQLTRSSRALPRAGQPPGKLDVPEALSKFQRSVLAARCQWNVRATGVPAGERPLGFAVSNMVKAKGHALRADYLVAPRCQFRISGLFSSLPREAHSVTIATSSPSRRAKAEGSTCASDLMTA